ncbi:MAG: lipid-binding SYLF domain-containing protein [Candidatus Rokuibacteriota bacterium]
MSAAAAWVVAIALVVAVSAVGVAPAAGDAAKDALDAEQLVERARLTVQSFAADKTMGQPVRDLLKKAKAVYIAPEVLRGAFIVGASGGSGVLLVRGDKGAWNGPAFYTIGEASFGLQAGGDKSEVMLLIMSDRGVSSMLASNVKLGADASVAAGPVGAGATAATANVSADIVSYSRAKGLYAGASLEGAVVAKQEGLNEAYYKKQDVTPTEILIKGTPVNKKAASLKAEVNKLASGK